MNSWLDSLTGRIEHSKELDRLGRSLSAAFSDVIHPGRLKDLLAGTWLAHPLHPMLTDVTIGAWTSSFLLDLMLGEKAREASDSLLGMGVLAALPTAATGLSDLADVVDEEERSVGAAHALANLTGISLYAIAYLVRRTGSRRFGMTLSALGAAVMTAAGFLGGHLAYRKGVGVDQTAFEAGIGEWTAVLDESELAGGKPRRVSVSRTEVLLVRVGETVHALANRCSHRGGPLHKGEFRDGKVTCPWHLSTFSLEDGAIVQGPATAPQPSYEVRVRKGKIELRGPAMSP